MNTPTVKTSVSSSVGIALAGCLASTLASAAPPSNSAYVTDAQRSHVEDATSDGIGQVNMIACIMSAMRPEMFVNKGPYIALVQESKCESKGGDSGGASSGAGSDAAQAPVYLNGIVNVTRASNNDPMISKMWLLQEEEGHQTEVNVHITATSAPTATNPYGVFRLFYCGHEVGVSGCRMNGYLEGANDGIRYFSTEDREDNNVADTQTTALRLNTTGTTSGSGRMQTTSIQGGSSLFDFAYNPALYLRTDGTDTQCFARDASDPDTGLSVWRYGLYDETSGARIALNTGFPIDFTHGGVTDHGFLGYYGLSLNNSAMAALQNGSVVQKVDYNGGQTATKTDYTVLKSGGRLTKYTRQARKLNQIDHVKFTLFVGNDASGFFTGAVSNTQYEMYWDESAGAFKVSGQMTCDQNGCQTSVLQSEPTVQPSYWQNQAGVQGFSQSLGGELFISLNGASSIGNSSTVDVYYRVQDLVYPADMASIPTLYCLNNCMTPGSLSAFFSPGTSAQSPYAASTYNRYTPSNLSDVVSYTLDATAAVLKEGGQEVTFTDAEALSQSSMYQYGVRSGRLFTSLAAAECAPASTTYCDGLVNQQEVYYQWETGSGSFNQFAGVKDANGHFLTFDAPLQVTFQVPANPQLYHEYAGHNLVLQYGGFGDLWGLPGTCVSRFTNAAVACNGPDSRYVPAFVIPDNATSGRVMHGSTPYLVKWLEREIRFAKKPDATCSSAQLTAAVGVQLPTSAVLKSPADPNADIYVGVKPVVTAAPRVIHGEVKY